jgi:uncharacterized protein YdiU (UPF0061 family)
MPFADFVNSYADLPERFYARQAPVPVAAPRLVKFNDALARELGLELNGVDMAALFAGNAVPPGADAMALAYAGHQFGHFVPQLGDGRAVLLGDVRDAQGVRRDIQLKGAGRTKFSRGGDGRAALGPVLREYLVSEAMHALGIPTTRALAAVTTGEVVMRETPLPGAVVTRVAASHVRVGTFQYFAAQGDDEGVRLLADYVIARHYPEVREAAQPYLALLEAVAERQAALIARWMQVGFIHGVMNTDNMAVSGETIDFGPCAFMDAYDPAQVYSAIDHAGRYAYANQPRIAQWNLARLAETLLPLIDADAERAVAVASAVINGFGARFEAHWLEGMRGKLGLRTAEAEDGALVQALLDVMQRHAADFTLVFRGLADGSARALFANPDDFDGWAADWQARLAREGADVAARAAAMQAVNPAVIPRNHRVEQALAAALGAQDFAPFEALLSVLMSPYEIAPGSEAYSAPPLADERVLNTFCGT